MTESEISLDVIVEKDEGEEEQQRRARCKHSRMILQQEQQPLGK